jgi:hypothetical protein
MVENKNNLVGKVVKAGIIGGLSLLPFVSNGQTNDSIQKGVNAATLKGETKTHFVYEFKFNENLKRAIKNSGSPHLYTTGVKNSYIKFNNDSSAFELYYPKESFDKNGKGKSIGLTIKDGNKVGPCDSTGLGSKYSPLPSLFWTPDNKVYLVEQNKNVPKEPSKEQPNAIYNVNETNTTNNTTNITNNNIYGDTSRIPKTKEAQQKLSPLEIRTLIESSKEVNNNNIGGISINPQIGRGHLWAGPYAKFNFGSKKDSVLTPVYEKTLLNQALGLFTETEGTRREYSKLKHTMEFGGVLSLDVTNDGRLRFDLSYGVTNERDERSDLKETGYDRMIQNGKVTDEKPYGPVVREKGETSKKWVQIQKAGVAVQPFKKVPIYFGGEVQNIGKLCSKQGFTTYNVKVGGKLWGKK